LYTAQGTLRAPWRIAGFLLVAALAAILVGTLAFAVLPLSGHATDMLASTSWILIIALVTAHAVMLRWVDRQPWGAVGLGRAQGAPATLARGWLLGAVAIGIPSAALLGAGLLRAVPTPGDAEAWLRFAGSMTAVLLPAALWEELAFRGYPFAVLRGAIGTRAALGVMSVAFGAVHRGNDPGAGVLPLVLVAAAGVFLGAVLVATRSLYAAWMAHFAWNWVMAVVLHTEVSGIPLAPPAYRVLERGPDWITGGGWGPEGGVPAGIGMALGIAYLVTRARRRGEQP
jgi:membrane protease YdiL (CAAX protease family)